MLHLVFPSAGCYLKWATVGPSHSIRYSDLTIFHTTVAGPQDCRALETRSAGASWKLCSQCRGRQENSHKSNQESFGTLKKKHICGLFLCRTVAGIQHTVAAAFWHLQSSLHQCTLLEEISLERGGSGWNGTVTEQGGQIRHPHPFLGLICLHKSTWTCTSD